MRESLVPNNQQPLSHHASVLHKQTNKEDTAAATTMEKRLGIVSKQPGKRNNEIQSSEREREKELRQFRFRSVCIPCGGRLGRQADRQAKYVWPKLN